MPKPKQDEPSWLQLPPLAGGCADTNEIFNELIRYNPREVEEWQRAVAAAFAGNAMIMFIADACEGDGPESLIAFGFLLGLIMARKARSL